MGTLIAKTVIQEVRNEIGDTDRPYTWDDDEYMFPALNSEVEAIRDEDTQAQIASDGTVRTVTEVTALTDTVSLDSSYREVLKEGIMRRIYQHVGEGRENRVRAAQHAEERSKALAR